MTDQPGAQAETVAESHESEAQQQEQPNWQAARETMAQQKQEMAQLRQQNNLLLQRQQEIQQAYQQREQATPFDGMDESDVATVGDFQRVIAHERQAFNEELAALRREQALLGYRAQYQDYDSVVQNTLEKAKTNPALAEAIASSKNPHLLAYELGKGQAAESAQQKANAQRMLENAQKPGSISQASTGGAALSQVDHIMNMSDADFEAKIAAIKRGG